SAWDITTGNPSIKIAIIGSGLHSLHPDLNDNLVGGWDVVSNDNNTEPHNHAYDHETACAGLAAGETNNGIGIAGVGYNCSIMTVQVSHTEDWDPHLAD